jgi:putative inorganic carbon (hco3(-)) transporter
VTTRAPAAPKAFPFPETVNRARLVAVVGIILLAFLLARAPLPVSVVAISGVGLALATLVQPAVGLVVLAAAIPFGDFLPLPIRYANAIDLLVALTIAGWLAQGIAQREVSFRRPSLLWQLAILLGIGALSLLQARSWSEGIPELLKWVEFAAIYLVATQVLGRRHVWWVVGALLAAGMVEVGLGAYQFLRQVGPEAFILAGRFMRAYGTFRQPNPYAGYLGYLVPVAVSLTLASGWLWWRSRKPIGVLVGLVCGITSLALVIGIGLSWSRGSWIALAAALLAVMAARNRRSAVAVAVAGLVLLVILMVAGAAWLPGALAARVSGLGSYVVGPDPTQTEITDDNFAALERLAHWQVGWRMFEDHPWIGVGIGNFGTEYAHYAPPHWYEPLGHAHNIFINFMAETGVLGLAAFLLFWLGAVRFTWQSARRLEGFPAALAIGVFGTLVYLTVHSLFDNLFVQHMQLQLALLLGCVASLDMAKAES